MLSGLSELGQAYLSILNVYSLAYGLGGALLGIMVGCLPGLSATLCIALLTPLSIKMAPNDAILILICSYVGTLYGGSRTAILLNIPGTAANAASCADGHALALRGEAGRAIGIATSGAFSGTLFGVLCLAAFTPLLAEVSLSFGAYEFFWLALLGVAMSGSIVGNDPLKGWLMGALGLFVAQIGQEGLYAHDRFTFGWSQLAGGIALIPALGGAGRHVLDPGPYHSGARARHSRLGTVGGFDGGHDHPWHPARADADDRAQAIHLRRGGDDVACARQHPGVRAVPDQAAVAGAQ